MFSPLSVVKTTTENRPFDKNLLQKPNLRRQNDDRKTAQNRDRKIGHWIPKSVSKRFRNRPPEGQNLAPTPSLSGPIVESKHGENSRPRPALNGLKVESGINSSIYKTFSYKYRTGMASLIETKPWEKPHRLRNRHDSNSNYALCYLVARFRSDFGAYFYDAKIIVHIRFSYDRLS